MDDDKIPNQEESAERRTHSGILIYPKFQLIMVASNSLIMFLMMGFISYQMTTSFDKFDEVGRIAQWPRTHDYFQFLAYQEDIFYTNIAWALVGGFVISTICTLALSHRMAGPILRMRNYFKELKNKGRHETVAPLQFRKTDFFSDLPPVINAAVGELTNTTKKKNTA